MNEKFSEYLKDLPPELQEKAKDIKTQEELLEFLSDNDVEIPEDALDAVAGGSSCDGTCAHTNTYQVNDEFYGRMRDDTPGYFRLYKCCACGADLAKFSSDGNNYRNIPMDIYNWSKEYADLEAECRAAVNRKEKLHGVMVQLTGGGGKKRR